MGTQRGRLTGTSDEEEEEGGGSECEFGTPSANLPGATFDSPTKRAQKANAQLPGNATWFAKARNIITEFLSSEDSYIAQLRLLHLKARPALAGLITADEERLLFANAGSLLQLHTSYIRPGLAEALARAERGESPELAQILLGIAPWLRLYIEYSGSFESGQTFLAKVQETNAEVAMAVKELAATPEARNLPLASAFLAPVQRLMRYQLLCQEYLRHVPKDVKERSKAEEALAALQAAADAANEHLRIQDSFAKVRRVEELLGLANLVKPTRRFVQEGDLLRLPNRGGRPVLRRLFLLNDVLLVGKKKWLGLGKSYRLRQVYELYDLDMDRVVGEATAFRLRCNTTRGTFRAPSPAQAEEWLTILANQKNLLHARTITDSAA